MFHPQRKTMDLLPLVCLCLLTWSAGTAADHSPAVVKVVIREDSDVILPCSFSSKENIVDKLFDWRKDGQRKKEVFYYNAGIHYNNGYDGQDQQFKGRVSYFSDQLKNGNASIKISNTQLADSGNYTCEFPSHQPSQIFYIELVVDPILRNRYPGVKGAAPEPYVTILDQTTDWSLLQCAVRGASPQPKVEWKDSAGDILPAKEPQVTDRGGSYNVILNTTVTTTDRYRCVVTQEEIHHQTSAEIYVHISGAAPEPFIKLVKTDDGVVLQCAVRDVSPQPKVEWKDSAGNILPAKEPQVTERGGSYDVTLEATVTKTDTFTCVVTQNDINHQISAKTYAEPLNEAQPPTADSTGWIVAAVLGTLLTLLLVGGGYLFVKHHKNKKTNNGVANGSTPTEEPNSSTPFRESC